MTLRPALALAAATLWLALGSFGCGADGGSGATGESRTVRGLLTDVKAASLLEIESITVQTDDGETHVIESGGRILTDFTPSHLREHMLRGEAVTVTFHEQGERLVLDDVSD